MSIKCGNHNQPTYHATLADVRACCAGAKGGEATYGDVILTDSENAKIAAGIREMESEGILPRRSGRVTSREFMAQHAGPLATVTRPAPQTATPKLSPKGREIAEGFGGSPKQFDFIYDLLVMCGGVSENFRWDVIVSIRLASIEIDRLKPLAAEARSAKIQRDYHEIYSDGAAYDAPKPATSNAPELATTDGIFRNPETGEIFKGQFNRAQGDGRRLYFKRLRLETDSASGFSIPLDGEFGARAAADQFRHLSWEYAGGSAKAKVQAAWILSREEAAAFGKLYGVCVRCHRDLTKEESIERAMGPICAGKQGW